MKTLLRTILITTLTLMPPVLFASDDHHSDEGEYGFEMNDKAMTTLNIQSSAVIKVSKNLFRVPNKALLVFAGKSGVFKQEGHRFELVEILVHKKNIDSIEIRSEHLKVNDRIVISGVPLLRITHLQTTGQGSSGHAH